MLLKTEVRDRNTDCFTFLYLHIFSSNENGMFVFQVVHESYEELVFSEPTEALYNKVLPIVSKPAPATSLIPHFPKHSDAEEFAKISKAREKVASLVSSIKKDQQAATGGAGGSDASAMQKQQQVKVEVV